MAIDEQARQQGGAKTQLVEAYIARMWSSSTAYLEEAVTLRQSQTHESTAFCWAFLAGNVLLFAAAYVRDAEGEIPTPTLGADETSPDVSGGIEYLGLSPEMKKTGLTYARYEDHGRYELMAPPASQDTVVAWADSVRTAFRKKYARYLTSPSSRAPAES